MGNETCDCHSEMKLVAFDKNKTNVEEWKFYKHVATCDFVPWTPWRKHLDRQLRELVDNICEIMYSVLVVEVDAEWNVYFKAPDGANWNSGGKRFILNVKFEEYAVPKFCFKRSPLTKKQNAHILRDFQWEHWQMVPTVYSIIQEIQGFLLQPLRRSARLQSSANEDSF